MKKSVLVVLILLAVVILGLFYYNYNYQLSDQNKYANAVDKEAKTDEANKPINNINEAITNKDYEIQIKDFAFSTKELKIKKGDSVTWTNIDAIGHTVTSDSGEELNSKLLSRNENYKPTFNKAGIFNYHCVPHPYMKGTIIVE